MERKCIICGTEYPVRSFWPDSGFCPNCKPAFLSAPLWFHRSPAGTRGVWQFLVVIHAVYFVFFSLLLDGGVLSVPVGVYSLSVFFYFVVRIPIGHQRGYPILTRRQIAGLLLLPLYGPVAFTFVFHFAQRLRYGPLETWF